VLRQVETGRVVRADTLEELAGRTGVPAAALAATVDRWNRQAAEGVDQDFLHHETLAAKGADPVLPPIAVAPFYAVQVLPNELVCTHAGIEIDSSAAALDEQGARVPGLYAAGEAGAGVLGPRYVGGGNAVANALTFGRAAGSGAAAAARTT